MELPTKGLLSEVSFIEILKDASASKLTGMIRLETGAVIKVVYLQNGTIAFASSNEKSDRLTEVLKRAGKLTPEQIEHAQARIKPNVSLGKTLVELGYISPKDLLWGARMQVEGILYQLLFWERGSYQVLEGPLPKEIVSLGLTVPQIIYNGILQTRNRDWVLQHIGSPEAIYVGATVFEDRNAEYHLPVDDIVSKMNGNRSLEELAQATGIDTFEVCKMVAALQILELVEPQPHKPLQMPLPVSETLEPEVMPDEETGRSGDISLGQVLQIPTVEELQQTPEQEPSSNDAYFISEDQNEEPESVTLAAEEEEKIPPPVAPTFGGLSKTVPPAVEEELSDSEYEEIPDEEGGGWKKVVLFVAIFGVILAAAAFYYVRKTSEPAETQTENRELPAPPDIQKPKPVEPDADKPVDSTPKVDPLQLSPPEPAPSNLTIQQDSPLKMATSGNLPAAAELWKKELRKNRSRQTIQVEIACQEKTVMEALNLFGTSAPVYVVPLSFRGQPCYRVLYGIYGNTAQAETELPNLPSQFLQQPSPPKVIPISKVLQ